MDKEHSRKARITLIKSQLRPGSVRNPALLEAVRRVPRELFVPETRRHLAYTDEDVVLGDGRFLMEPRLTALLLQSAELGQEDSVLVIGGCGYMAALAGYLVQTVFILEQDPDYVRHCEHLLTSLHIDNTVLKNGAFSDGWPEQSPYDAILFDGAIAGLPEAMTAQIEDGGRILAMQEPAFEGGTGHGRLWMKRNGHLSSRWLFDGTTPVLPGLGKETQLAR